MNRISGERVGVDGERHSVERICTDYVSLVEGKIKKKLTKKIESLSTGDQSLARLILNNLHDLLTADVLELRGFVDFFDTNYPNRFCEKPCGHWKSTDLGTAILDAFNYSHYRETVLVDVARKLNVKTCPYCNMQYTLYANEMVSGKKAKTDGLTRFQFDHFFDKLHYPMLSMSFYNLIPSCSICNQGKSAKALSLSYHPYYSDIHK